MISVVLTAYNAQPFVQDSIRSLLGQSYGDIECIVVDDGSSDGTVDAVRSLGDRRIHLIQVGRIGRGRALNEGLRASQGEYVAIQDADDLSHPRRLEIEKAELEKWPDLAGIGSEQVLVTDGWKPAWWSLDKQEEEGNRPDDVSSILVYYNPIPHTSLLVRRAAVVDVKGYDENRSDLYDWDLYVRLVASGYRLGRLRVPLVAKRVHEGQYFEAARRLFYVWHCYEFQRQARRRLKAGGLAECAFLGLFVYRLLPPRLRFGWGRFRKAL